MKRLAGLPFKVLWAIIVFSVPLLGFWLSSSLAVYFNGPIWAAAVVGVLFFPVLPLLWEAWATSKKPKVRYLTPFSRIVLRTLVTNLVLLAGLLAFYPQGSFRALSTRGDWMIDKQTGPRAEQARDAMFWAADRLEWLYVAAQPEAPLVVAAKDDVLPVPAPRRTPKFKQVRVATPTVAAELVPDTTRPEVRRDLWPMPDRLHPLATSIPEDVQTDYATVARYIAKEERDPYARIKAIHDYIAHRVAYDVDTMGKTGPARKSQDPKTVFDSKLGVCDGYAQLFEAMVEEAGGQAEYVGGKSRDAYGQVSDVDHAWNAVVVDGYWFLVDVTWNAGHVKGGKFVRAYRSDYLLTPPSLFGVTHYPDHEKWQLLDEPITRGEFLRKPLLRPEFHAQGLILVAPERSQVTTDDVQFEIRLKNPGRLYLIGRIVSSEMGDVDCMVESHAGESKIRCPTPKKGEYLIRMYGAKVAHDSYPLVGIFDVNKV